MIMTGIFVLPNLCESYLSMDAKIEKSYQIGKGAGDTNIHKSDSVSMNYDAFTGTIMISTTSDSKEVGVNIYKEWYNEQGELVGKGETFAVPAGVSASAYRVKAEALSDGAISYSAMEPAESSTIKSVQSDPGSVNVIFEGPANSGTTLRLASATGNAPVAEYSVEAGSTACNIPADKLASGVYQVTMVENGVVVGTKKFTK